MKGTKTFWVTCQRCGRQFEDRFGERGYCEGCEHAHYSAYWSRDLLIPSDRGMAKSIRMAFLGLLFAITGTLTSYASPTQGIASYYGLEACSVNPDPKCPTASGRSLYELEKEKVPYAAMWGVPIGSRVRVCSVASGDCTGVIILDRGPNKRLGRIIDLNEESFKRLADTRQGITQVTVEVLNGNL